MSLLLNMSEIEIIDEHVVVGEIISNRAISETVTVDINHKSDFLPEGRNKLSREWLDTDKVVTGREPTDDKLYEVKETRRCSSCKSEPIYDQKTEEYYCPVCEQ